MLKLRFDWYIKIHHLSLFITTHGAFDISDASSMPDACVLEYPRDGPDSQNSKQLFTEITEVMLVQIRSVPLSSDSLPLCFDELL